MAAAKTVMGLIDLVNTLIAHITWSGHVFQNFERCTGGSETFWTTRRWRQKQKMKQTKKEAYVQTFVPLNVDLLGIEFLNLLVIEREIFR